MPVTDECTQDWSLLSGGVSTDGLVFEAQRSLDTGDPQDRVFIDDSADGQFTVGIDAPIICAGEEGRGISDKGQGRPSVSRTRHFAAGVVVNSVQYTVPVSYPYSSYCR